MCSSDLPREPGAQKAAVPKVAAPRAQKAAAQNNQSAVQAARRTAGKLKNGEIP